MVVVLIRKKEQPLMCIIMPLYRFGLLREREKSKLILFYGVGTLNAMSKKALLDI